MGQDKEKKKLADKLRYECNKAKIQEQQKIYYENNKEQITDKKKEYYQNNKEQIIEKQKEYNKNYVPIKKQKGYSEKDKEYFQNYRKQNKEKLTEYKKEYTKKRYETDPLFKLTRLIRNNIITSLKKSGFKKMSRTEQILNCSFTEFKQHIESLWQPWMNWNNYGNWNGIPTEINTAWDIDHIIPLSTATNEIELLQLNHFSNLQPLCSYTNRFIKRNNPI